MQHLAIVFVIIGTFPFLNATTPLPPVTNTACLQNNHCWLNYAFKYDNSWNSCLNGDQYIKMYDEYYVGVVLCSQKRYKILMSESLNGTFLNIGDENSSGENQCELLGGESSNERNTTLDRNFLHSPSTIGYYRNELGGTIQKGHIGGGPTKTGKYYGHWYECGINIPGTDQMLATTLRACLENNHCWLRYPFKYDDDGSWNSCYGDQYVTKYSEHYVGVILCSQKKYKIFISDSLDETFLNIGDGSGIGENHCEFIGAESSNKENITLDRDFVKSHSQIGFYRRKWGATIQKGDIGGSPRWYGCGIDIPGTNQVLDYKDFLDTVLTSTPAYSIVPMETCNLSKNSAYAAATPISQKDIYSCNLCTSTAYEVHVINMYQPEGSSRHFQQDPGYVVRVPLEIFSKNYVEIILVLMTYEAAIWEIYQGSNVKIRQILLDSYYYDITRVTLKSQHSYIKVVKGNNYYSGWSEDWQIKSYVESKYGYMSTLTAVYHASSWKLNAGICGHTYDRNKPSMPIVQPWRTTTRRWHNTIAPGFCDEAIQDSNNVLATHPRGRRTYYTYSCTPCPPGLYEVHVINMYQPSNTGEVPLEVISHRENVNIMLLLMNYEGTHWIISNPNDAKIRGVLLVSYHNSRVSFRNFYNYQPEVTKKQRRYISGSSDINRIKQYANQELGHMSSYTYVYETSEWTLNVGVCQQQFQYTTSAGLTEHNLDEYSSGHSSQVIVGIVVGALIIIAGVGCLVVILNLMVCKRRSTSRPQHDHTYNGNQTIVYYPVQAEADHTNGTQNAVQIRGETGLNSSQQQHNSNVPPQQSDQNIPNATQTRQNQPNTEQVGQSNIMDPPPNYDEALAASRPVVNDNEMPPAYESLNLELQLESANLRLTDTTET